MVIGMAVLTLGSVAFFFGVTLAIADVKLRVEVDPRIEEIDAALPQANCGTCGFPGCKAYAKAIVGDGVGITQCAPGGQGVVDLVARIMGLEATCSAEIVARVHCRGSEAAAIRKALYDGIDSCQACALVSSGDKLCDWGCLGLGDCVLSCPFDAIAMGEDGLPVVDECKCTGCGNCVDTCPKNILELHPMAENVIVFCRSQDPPKLSKKVCDNACIACRICVKGCKTGGIELKNNLAAITDPGQVTEACYKGIIKCPTGAIGFVHPERVAQLAADMNQKPEDKSDTDLANGASDE
jgi:RnfABCDGE-type electron transport complex B subunit